MLKSSFDISIRNSMHPLIFLLFFLENANRTPWNFSMTEEQTGITSIFYNQLIPQYQHLIYILEKKQQEVRYLMSNF